MSLIVGIDVGGTFTDLVVVDSETSSARSVKTPSTPADQSLGLMSALEEASIDPRDVSLIVHGTTVATNALIEGKGARTALVTTKGFRDVIELRNRHRPEMYGLTGSFTPLIPRHRRYEVPERITAQGEVGIPLDEDELERCVQTMRAEGVESIAVSFLHSYVNDRHERRAVELICRSWPNQYVTPGSELLAEVRELERTSTVSANAFVQPIMGDYLRKLEARLQEAGFEGSLLLIQSNGGVIGPDEAVRKAVNTVLSGPAAGVAGVSEVSNTVEARKVIAMDMGGTSLDVSVVLDGRPRVCTQKEIRYGVPIRGQMIEIETVGAGGGSIAKLDRRGILTIGPESAGADPGPACYGKGGKQPTITDANVVLGRIDPGSAIGRNQGVTLDRSLAEKAIEEGIGKPLGLDVEDAAEAILTVAINKISGHLRKATISEGLDPRDMSLVAFGGAGPLHASALLKEMRFASVIIPERPGVLSAQGCVLAEFRHDTVQTVYRPLWELSADTLKEITARHAAQSIRLLNKDRTSDAEIIVETRGDLYYRGQTHPLLVELDSDNLDPMDIEPRFRSAYQQRFGRSLDAEIELLNLRTSVRIRRPRITLRYEPSRAEPNGRRPVHLGGKVVDCAVFQRSLLVPGRAIEGPALIEQPDTTVVVEPGVVATHTQANTLLLAEA
jgi:N-methylhydantoinase A